VGKGKAMEMITSAQMIGAAEAKEWGLVNQVVPQEELMNTCMTIAQKIANNSPRAISAALRSVLSGYSFAENGLNTEIKEFGECFGTADFKEGTTAFMEKRKPTFEGK
jgi:enoyl-CoA hydratase